ncbi:uncharacterized protein N7482_003924 [Penicillium canariense]|uniref:Uncharacterized protein n=1 Tax=Penicillium canariense TaxID=189055 RepID=A0A9W9I5N5_9EURO|nr:uncharacterized protein N7482_003924 [Penicillium canariense]KAJ5168330.1 hypothetical protein N7482_003924 [Penicillium canariense]
MAEHRDRSAGDVPPQLPLSRRRSLFEPKHIDHHHDSPNSPRLSSEYVYSDEKEISDAIVVPTPSGDSRGYETMFQMGPLMEEGLAANIAMFIPTGSCGSSPALTAHCCNKRRECKKVDSAWWRNQVLSDPSSNRPRHLPSRPLSETTSTAETTQSHRRAVSLDTVDSSGHTSNWPGKPGPAVMLNQPQYPPPERIPTPPGLPSFNTPEAVYFSAQFLTGQNAERFYAQRDVPGTEQRSTSYSDAFRRLFGLPSSLDTRIHTQSDGRIGRVDGTAIVYGRFPYRQSGHNSTMARQIHDHPFYQNDLPLAETGDEAGTEAASTKDANVRSQRGAWGYVPPSMQQLWPFAGGHLSSTPESTATSQLGISDRAHSFFGVSLGPSSRSDRSSGAPPTNRQGIGAVGNHAPPDHSRLRPVQTNDSDEEVLLEGPYSAFGILSWLPVQMYLCCLLRVCPLSQTDSDMEALETTPSRDTYVTARSRPSNSAPQPTEVREEVRRFGQMEFPNWVADTLGRRPPYTSSRASISVQSNG